MPSAALSPSLTLAWLHALHNEVDFYVGLNWRVSSKPALKGGLIDGDK